MRTTSGRVRGSSRDGVSAFLGIAHAAPPVGGNRMRPPRPVEPWTGARNATAIDPEPPSRSSPRRSHRRALRPRRAGWGLSEPRRPDTGPGSVRAARHGPEPGARGAGPGTSAGRRS
ncbi:carboxylesterase family protein [Geodermatophilus sp. SYSU D00805]